MNPDVHIVDENFQPETRVADNEKINDLLNDAINKWIEVCDIDLTDTSYAWSSDKTFSNANLVKIGKSIGEARDMDPTGLTAFMMLRGVWTDYLKAFKFSAWDLIMDRGVVENLVTRMTALREVLEDPSVVLLISNFEDELRVVAKQYGVEDTGPLEKLIADKWSLAYIRRDALLALDSLEAHQFCQGDPVADELGYNDSVLEFWNMNSLLRMMRAQGDKPGTSLCLIRDPEELWSFFAFAIVNGPNMTVLTDRQRRTHPDQKHMSRSRAQSKRFVERANRFWFPYELLELAVTADGKALFAKARTALVPINVEAVKLKRLGDLEATDYIWLSLMFDLISKKYGADAVNAKLPQLSYTGEMVVNPNTLVGDGALVRQGHYTPLELDPLTSEVVNSPEAKAQYTPGYGSEKILSTGFNDWMIERYGDQVPNDLLELVGGASAHHQLMDSAERKERKDVWGRDKTPSYELTIGQDKIEVLVGYGRSGIGFMEPTDFGPKEEIAKDRAWYGRKNSMVVIQRLALAEYKREKETILGWYSKKIRSRLEWFITQCARGELLMPSARVGSWETEHTREQENGMRQWDHRYWNQDSYIHFASRDICFNYAESDQVWDRARCPVTGALASIHTQIRPTCPEGIAFLCGCSVDELPWALQHWYDRAPYSGNSILTRVDPTDWVLDNPWMKHHNLTIGLSLSKTAVHRRRKLMGLPRQTWKKEEED